MENLPSLTEADFGNKKIIVRCDLDGESRLDLLVPTVKLILEKNPSQILLIGHNGRPARTDEPEGKINEELSLKKIVSTLSENLGVEVEFVDSPQNLKNSNGKVLLLENLRFFEGEERNDESFAKLISVGFDIFINEAFASSHRNHASIVGIPKLLPSYFGLHFLKEIQNLSQVRENPKRPLIAIISGVKKDKLDYLDKFKEFCDKVLIGGRLPEFMDEYYSDPKVIIARLLPDKEDITIHSIEIFESEIGSAETIFLSGPIGKYEEDGHMLGTRRVFEAIKNSNALKVAGGGDTTMALKKLNMENGFDWVSSGGGASLDYVANGTLPGIEAIRQNSTE